MQSNHTIECPRRQEYSRIAPTETISLLSPGRPPPRSTLFPYTTLFRSSVKRRYAPCRPRTRGRGRSKGSSSEGRSEEHTSELQSPCNLVCRLLLEKKNNRDSS